jgi:hypothetical protein
MIEPLEAPLEGRNSKQSKEARQKTQRKALSK